MNQQKRLQSVTVGNFRVIYQPITEWKQLKAYLQRQGLRISETSHFLLGFTTTESQITLIHCFSPEEIDNNVGYFLMQELAPLGLMTSDQAFGDILVGIVTSLVPDNPVTAWSFFSFNTLQRFRKYLTSSIEDVQQDFIIPFAYIYRRLFDLKVGSSLLDVGCACAFWPLLVAERTSSKGGTIIGIDNRDAAINLSCQLATVANIRNVEFIKSDVLTDDFLQLGTFDTVTAIHFLEHLTESQTVQAMHNLLHVTRYRLLIAVPYEEQAEVAFGHEQVFSREKLAQWGNWCIKQLDGKAHIWCEDVYGGLLVIERDNY